ncbi:uncharacterized protein V1513DRAFT_467290 [Lipomyces chichibuensis]|uniref:uncharacterized protein n=1 Tax=Lipomyces chichibuensis TaxID=1546026 RepID=UPI0033435299
MSRSSRTFRITALLPSSLTPADMISALHVHENCLTLQALTTGYKEVPTTCPAVLNDPYFSPTDTSPIKTYEVTEGVIIIPGIADLGKKFITFPVWLQDTPSGLKTRADAPAGVVVRAEWRVQPDRAYGEVEREYTQWTLVEDVTVQCAWWLIWFVKKNMEYAHKDICWKLVEKTVKEKRTGGAREAS